MSVSLRNEETTVKALIGEAEYGQISESIKRSIENSEKDGDFAKAMEIALGLRPESESLAKRGVCVKELIGEAEYGQISEPTKRRIELCEKHGNFEKARQIASSIPGVQSLEGRLAERVQARQPSLTEGRGILNPSGYSSPGLYKMEGGQLHKLGSYAFIANPIGLEKGVYRVLGAGGIAKMNVGDCAIDPVGFPKGIYQVKDRDGEFTFEKLGTNSAIFTEKIIGLENSEDVEGVGIYNEKPGILLDEGEGPILYEVSEGTTISGLADFPQDVYRVGGGGKLEKLNAGNCIVNPKGYRDGLYEPGVYRVGGAGQLEKLEFGAVVTNPVGQSLGTYQAQGDGMPLRKLEVGALIVNPAGQPSGIYHVQEDGAPLKKLEAGAMVTNPAGQPPGVYRLQGGEAGFTFEKLEIGAIVARPVGQPPGVYRVREDGTGFEKLKAGTAVANPPGQLPGVYLVQASGMSFRKLEVGAVVANPRGQPPGAYQVQEDGVPLKKLEIGAIVARPAGQPSGMYQVQEDGAPLKKLEFGAVIANPAGQPPGMYQVQGGWAPAPLKKLEVGVVVANPRGQPPGVYQVQGDGAPLKKLEIGTVIDNPPEQPPGVYQVQANGTQFKFEQLKADALVANPVGRLPGLYQVREEVREDRTQFKFEKVEIGAIVACPVGQPPGVYQVQEDGAQFKFEKLEADALVADPVGRSPGLYQVQENGTRFEKLRTGAIVTNPPGQPPGAYQVRVGGAQLKKLETGAQVIDPAGRLPGMYQVQENGTLVPSASRQPINVGSLCDGIAARYYGKTLPEYEDIEVIYNGNKTKWVKLTTEQQFKLLREGARATWAEKVERRYQEFQRLDEQKMPEDKIKARMGGVIGEMIGANPGKFPSVHGVNHCTRVALVTEAVARVYRTLFKEFEDMSDDDIALAIAAATFHDSGRQGEEVDIFDALSAQNAERELGNLGLSQEQAKRCASAIERKDSPAAGKDPIAILLHEADCLEIQRLDSFRVGRVRFGTSFLDANQEDSITKERILTLREGVSEGQVNEALEKLAEQAKKLIENTDDDYGKLTGYDEFRNEAKTVGLLGETPPPTLSPLPSSTPSPKPKLLLEFTAAFDALGICETPEEVAELSGLIEQLHAKSPEMLAGILDNCQWLKGKGKDSFIYSVAAASMQMELGDIFDQRDFDALGQGIQPETGVMLGAFDMVRTGKLFDAASRTVVGKSGQKFFDWLDGKDELRSNIADEPISPLLKIGGDLERKGSGPKNAHWRVWRKWMATAEMVPVRKAVIDGVLNQPIDVGSFPDAGDYVDDAYIKEANIAKKFLPLNYAYTQLLLRHATFPGHDQGPPPTVLAVRRVRREALTGISRHGALEKTPARETITYDVNRALPVESWALVSPVGGEYPYGEAALYGKIPAYAILTSVLTNEFCSDLQKELVVIPFSEMEVVVDKNFDEEEYLRDEVLPAMEQQYGPSEPGHSTIGRAREILADPRTHDRFQSILEKRRHEAEKLGVSL
ncbi:MAG: hypothetical protein LBJ94_01305 [Puniceicoccales bacterium]|jgi:hypothetical protein|nr:hypothetical protein [Puniceicoccales bacterium]